MTWLLLALTLHAPLSQAEPTPESSALAEAPADSSRRLALARALLARPGWEEVGLDALTAMRHDPAAASEARSTLVDFLGRLDGRPGWGQLYQDLLSLGPFKGSDIIRVRAAEARALDRATASKGLTELDALATTADPQLARTVGRAFLRVGEADRAARSYGLGGAAGAEGQVLAALAKGDMVTATALTEAGAPKAIGVAEALRLGSLASRAESLAANGFVVMAAKMLESGSLDEHGRQLAALYQAKGRYAEATSVLLRLRKAGLADEATDRRLAEVYAARRMYREAMPLVPGDPAFTEQLRALAAYRGAWESRSKADDAAALDAAWRSAPTDPFVAREWGKAKLAANLPEEALPSLGLALDIDPTDADALGLYGLSAQKVGSTSSIVRRLLAGAAAETSASDRAKLMSKAAIYLGILAEEYKARGAFDDAIDTYLIGAVLQPNETSTALGAAGLLWQAQRLPGALALYEMARAKRPQDPELLLHCARLRTQLGDEVGALALLTSTKLNDSRVKLLRRTIENGIRARDARAAADAGELEKAAQLWRELHAQWPDEPEFIHGLADSLAGLGQYEEALTAYRRTLELNANDAWAALGQANCLIALGRPIDARETIERAYRTGLDPSADAEQPKVLARAWRSEAQVLQDAGRSLEAFAAWREAFERVPEVWATNGLASLYLERDQPEVAVSFYEEALELERNLASGVGWAVALERLGRWDEAKAAADDLVLIDPDDKKVLARREIVQRVSVAQAEYERRSGKPRLAIERLTAIAETEGYTSEMRAALAAASLDVMDCSTANDAATRAMELAPGNEWGIDVANRAGTVCRTMSALYPHIQEAVRMGGHDPEKQLRAARLELTIQRAEKLLAGGRHAEAATPLQEAETLGPANADEWARLGGAWVAIGETDRGLSSFRRALEAQPKHVPAIIGIGGALRAQVRLLAAEEHLQRYFDELQDPRIGLQLIQLQVQRGQYRKAENTLVQVKGQTLPSSAPPAVEAAAVNPLPVLPLPSGRRPEPRTWPPTPPQDLQPRWLVDARESIDIALLRETGTYVSVGGGVFQRPGNPGEQELVGWYFPVEAVFPPIGLLRLNADAMPISLSDGQDDVFGVSTSIGIASPPFRRLFATARVGTSPIGFEQINVLWSAHLRYGLSPRLAVGGMTSRVPVSDSLLSWAGKTDLVTGQFFGLISQVSFGGYASLSPSDVVDAGALLRSGWTEGTGVEINPFVEGVIWAGGSFRGAKTETRLGGEAVLATHERQEDGFLLGEGGYFSPALFAMFGPNFRLTARFGGARGVLCTTAFAGGQYVGGETTPWFSSGFSGVGRAGLGASARLSPNVSVGLDGRVQITTDLWHQEAAILHIDIGLQPGGPSAPTMTTVASPGAILPSSADLCRVE